MIPHTCITDGVFFLSFWRIGISFCIDGAEDEKVSDRSRRILQESKSISKQKHH